MPRHVNRTHPLAKKGNDYDPNWLALERYFNAMLPVCVTATGDPGVLVSGTPGPLSLITWTQPTNLLYDISNIVGPVPTTNLRIPMDGFYDFWYMLQLGTADKGFFGVRSFLDVANTSSSGFNILNWIRVVNGPSQMFDASFAVPGGHRFLEVLYRGIEMHANDLYRIGLNVYADPSGVQVADIPGSVVPFSEFRMTYPIPNIQVTQP